MFRKAKSLGKSLLIASGAIVFSVGIYAVTAEFIGPGLKGSTDNDRPLGTAINVLFGTNADQVEIANDCSSSTAEICLDADDGYDMDSSNVVANASGSVIERLEWLIENKIDDKNCQIGTVNGAGLDSDGDAVVYDFDYFINGTTQTGTYLNEITNGQEIYTASISCTQTVASLVADSETTSYACDAGFHEAGGICVSNGECQFDGSGDMFVECDLASDLLPVEDVFSTYLYEGNGSTQTINNGIDLTGEGGLVWIKNRDVTDGHQLFDTERGISTVIVTSTSRINVYQSNFGITDFNQNGFSLGGERTSGVNQIGENHVSWTFRQAPNFFDVVTYTGDGTSNRQIAHELGIEPGMIMTKSTSTAGDWNTYHRSATGDLKLNTTDAQTGSKTIIPSASSINFTVSGVANTNGVSYVAYVYAHNEGEDGKIQCGDFTTDGSGNTEIDLGWEPQWVITKTTWLPDPWRIADSMRGMTTLWAEDTYLFANSSNAEGITTSNAKPYATWFYMNFNWPAYGNKNFIYCAIRAPQKEPVNSSEVFANALQYGTGTNPRILTGVGITPDFVLMSDRVTAGAKGIIWDRLRGGASTLATYSTSTDTGLFGASHIFNFTMNGITIKSIATALNASGVSFSHYMFKRAPGFFDVVAYEGNGVAGRTVEHNLGVEPEMMIIRSRNETDHWAVYSATTGAWYYQRLNTTDSKMSTTYWNNTIPTSSVYTLGDYGVNRLNNDYISYLFASVPDVSKVGYYTGTATDLDIDAGFTGGTRFVLIKRTDANGDWYLYDTERGIIEGNDPYLLLNTTDAEVTGTDYIDPIDAGFRITASAPDALNAAGGEYIFLAIAGDNGKTQ